MAKPILLLTRPAASSVRFAAQLEPVVATRADLLISPLLEIVPLNPDVDLAGYAGVIFTSANGVSQAPAGDGRAAYCVGRQTAAAAAGKQWSVKSTAQDAENLISLLKESAQAPLLHLCGVHHRGDVAERLTGFGLRTERIEVYDQKPRALTDVAQDALSGEGRVILPLFSPRTAAYLAAQARSLKDVFAVAMSAAVADQLQGYDFASIQILPQPTRIEMLRAVELLLTRDSLA